jgi:hypothetical protein
MKGKYKHNLEGITKVELMQDKKGTYIAYCKLEHHTGILNSKRAEMCELRKCDNYRKLYIKYGISLTSEEFDL